MADDAVTILLGAEEREALDAYRRDLGPSASRADALAAILREWMSRPGDTAGGEAADQGLRPSELNSSNDI